MFAVNGDGESGVVYVEKNVEKFQRRVINSTEEFEDRVKGLSKGEEEVKMFAEE